MGSKATEESRPGPQVWLEQLRKLWYSLLRWEGLGEGQAGSNAQELHFGETELKTSVRYGDVKPRFGATFYRLGHQGGTGKSFLKSSPPGLGFRSEDLQSLQHQLPRAVDSRKGNH